MPFPHALMVAGTRSGSGKTTLTLCLLAAVKKRGLSVQCCKAGPDFIDPTHHAALTGRASYNMDAWMGGEEGMERVYARMSARPADMLLAEGVMGLFDGAEGMGGPGSSAHLARSLDIPILLVVDVRGMGQSAAALAAGYVREDKSLQFAGVVCSHVGSEAHADMLREAFATTFKEGDPPLLGLLPRKGLPDLPSRHLGLVMAGERIWQEADVNAMANWAEAHLDMDALLARCTPPRKLRLDARTAASDIAPVKKRIDIAPTKQRIGIAPVKQRIDIAPVKKRIAIAKDIAFCFLYPDMPAVLEELGAECLFFSPLKDKALPENCAALYFPGGYPELHAQELAANAPMLQAVRDFAATGRIYAECGGFIYLMDSVEVHNKSHPLCACLPLSCRLNEQKAALGYREVRMLNTEERQNPTARGHEFHYASLTNPLEFQGLSPLWQVHDRKGRPLTGEVQGVHYVHEYEQEPAQGQGRILASWVHLYPEGARALLTSIFDLHSENI